MLPPDDIEAARFWRSLAAGMREGKKLEEVLDRLAASPEATQDPKSAEIRGAMRTALATGTKWIDALHSSPRYFPSSVRSVLEASFSRDMAAQGAEWIAEDLEAGFIPVGDSEPSQPAYLSDRAAQTRARARFWRELGRLLQSGTSLTDSLIIASWDSKDLHLLDFVRKVQDDVRQGIPFHTTLTGTGNRFTKEEWEAMKAAEEQGDIARACVNLAIKLLNNIPAEISDVKANGWPEEEVKKEKVPEEGVDKMLMKFTESDILYSGPNVVSLVNLILLKAIQDRASELHFEYSEDTFRVRYRIDGVLYEMMPLPFHRAQVILNRVKVMAHIRQTDPHSPWSDGFIDLELHKGSSCCCLDEIIDTALPLPVIHMHVRVTRCVGGERLMIKIIDESTIPRELSALGLSPDALACVRGWMKKFRGLIFVTGPARNGVTTTLYSMLNELNSAQITMTTVVEDPWVNMSGITQIRVGPGTEMTHHQGLKIALDLGSDVVLVSPVPDAQTLSLMCDAALGDRLLLGSLPAADAGGALLRLAQMAPSKDGLATALTGVLNTRLVRKLCKACREELDLSALPPAEKAFIAGTQMEKCYRSPGCDLCNNTGYFRRTGIFECLEMTEALRQAIRAHPEVSDIPTLVRQSLGETLKKSGLIQAAEGIIPVSEVLRVLS